MPWPFALRLTYRVDQLFAKEDGPEEWWAKVVAWHQVSTNHLSIVQTKLYI